MLKDVPIAIVAVTVSSYWLAVLIMAARSWLRAWGPAGVIPKVRRERWMWLIWVPNTIAWIALPWLAWDNSDEGTMLQLGVAWTVARWSAAFVAAIALFATMHCWLAMGSNWSMAVNPRKTTNLLTGGIFSVVRHPIYALSLLLMAMTVIVVANWAMLLVGSLHVGMILAKTKSEEQYLRQVHGQPYEQYCCQTDRYVPFRYVSGRLRSSPRTSP